MPTLAVNDFNIVVSVLGGWVSLFGLVSYLCKENFYLSEALISLLAGVAFSPAAANLIRPLDYAGSEHNLNSVTLYFSRLVLGVQLVLAGVQLPSRYLRHEWKPLSILLGPIMTLMWLATSLLVWGLVPGLPFLHALAIGSCVTPTDPVLSNVIVKGKFADHNVPKDLQQIIIAESGANDGLGYPFLFLALYLIKYTGDSSAAHGSPGTAIGLWFGETWGYTILLSVVYGAVVGWVAKELLHWAEERKFVDRESFLVFAISLALFITGTCGLIGSDDVLACFIAGNAFTWDDWFRLQTLDDSLQPTVDMLLNVAIFMWFGAVCPWSAFLSSGVVPLHRLVFLGVLVLLLRRLPWLLLVRGYVPQLRDLRQAVFMGFFGPVGVSAVFYLYITLEFVETLVGADGVGPREDVAELGEAVKVVVWFIAICSIVVHGLSIPLGKLGFYLPRTLSRSYQNSPQSTEDNNNNSSNNNDDDGAGLPPFNLGSRVSSLTLRRNTPGGGGGGGGAMATGSSSSEAAASNVGRLPVYKIGGSIVPAQQRPLGRMGREEDVERGGGGGGGDGEGGESPAAVGGGGGTRTIRFPDEEMGGVAGGEGR